MSKATCCIITQDEKLGVSLVLRDGRACAPSFLLTNLHSTLLLRVSVELLNESATNAAKL